MFLGVVASLLLIIACSTETPAQQAEPSKTKADVQPPIAATAPRTPATVKDTQEDISSEDRIPQSATSESIAPSNYQDSTIPSQSTVSPSSTDTSSCSQVVYPAAVSGGCRIRLVSPASCQEITFPFQFEWTTDGSNCETPYKLYITGDPPLERYFEWSLSENTGQISKTGGGFATVSAEDLANVGVTSKSGVYHWVVMGYYGSHPDSQGFIAR